MARSRREFLQSCGAGALSWAAVSLVPGVFQIDRLEAAPPDPDVLRGLAAFALEQARKAGAVYADVRINRYRTQAVSLRSQPDFATGKLNHVPAISDTESFGFGIRALAAGAWGFAASNRVTRDEIARAARDAADIAKTNASLRLAPVQLAKVKAWTDTYRTPIVKDPFDVPVAEKLELMRSVNDEVKKVEGVFSSVFSLAQRVEHRFFASTDGSVIEQHVYQISPEVTATAVERGRKSKSRTYRDRKSVV